MPPRPARSAGPGPRRRRAAAGQEGEALQVIAQLVEAVGGMAGELFLRCGRTCAIAGQPAREKLLYFSEFGGIGFVKPYFGMRSPPSLTGQASVKP
jgi:hypothetical protein